MLHSLPHCLVVLTVKKVGQKYDLKVRTRTLRRTHAQFLDQSTATASEPHGWSLSPPLAQRGQRDSCSSAAPSHLRE